MPKLATQPDEPPPMVFKSPWKRSHPRANNPAIRQTQLLRIASTIDKKASVTKIFTGSTENPQKTSQPSTTKNPSIAFIEMHLGIAQDRLERLCRLQHLSVEEAEDFRSTAILKLLEKSARIERQYQGRSNLATYFDAVLTNILRDYRVAKWGKWRPSARATQLGPLAVSLERLIHRDRLPPNDAVNILSRACFPWRRAEPKALEEELWEIVARLPARIDRRAVVDTDTLEEQLADEGAALEFEIESAVQELDGLRTALLDALAKLSSKQRIVLRLRYGQGLTFAEIEDRTGMQTSSLYRQVARTLRTLRRLITDSGVSADAALKAHDTGAGDFCIDRLFKAAGM